MDAQVQARFAESRKRSRNLLAVAQNRQDEHPGPAGGVSTATLARTGASFSRETSCQRVGCTSKGWGALRQPVVRVGGRCAGARRARYALLQECDPRLDPMDLFPGKRSRGA